MIDYVFYRISKFYTSKKEDPFGYTFAFVCILCLSFLFFLINLINLCFEGVFSRESRVFDANELGWIYGITGALIISLNLWHYGQKGRRIRIFEQYKSSPKNKSIRTWQIFIFPILVFTSSIVLVKILK